MATDLIELMKRTAYVIAFVPAAEGDGMVQVRIDPKEIINHIERGKASEGDTAKDDDPGC